MRMVRRHRAYVLARRASSGRAHVLEWACLLFDTWTQSRCPDARERSPTDLGPLAFGGCGRLAAPRAVSGQPFALARRVVARPEHQGEVDPRPPRRARLHAERAFRLPPDREGRGRPARGRRIRASVVPVRRVALRTRSFRTRGPPAPAGLSRFAPV